MWRAFSLSETDRPKPIGTEDAATAATHDIARNLWSGCHEQPPLDDHSLASALPAPGADSHDPELVLKARSGSHDAFGLLVVRYSRSVRAQCLARLGLRDDLDDLVQETFLRAFQGLSRLEDARRFGAFVHRIAHNICIDRLRRRGRNAVSLDEVDLSPPAEPGTLTDVREERLSLLRRQVGRLPEALREAVLMFYFDELTHAQIAERLDITEAAVNQRLHRARQSLKVAFEQGGAV